MKKNNTIFTVIIILIIVILLLIKLLPNMLNKTNYDDLEVYKNNIDILICNGENAKNIIKSAEKCGMNKENIYYFEEKKQVQEFVESNWEKGDVILFKASNGMKFFDIVSNLEKA